MMPYMQLNKRGFALSIVLWIVAALLFGISTLALLSKDTFTLTKGVNAKLKTELVSEDVLESLKFYVLTADYDNISFKNSALDDFKYEFPSQIVADNRWYNIGKNVQLRLKDTSSMLNVLKTTPSTIAGLATDSSQRQRRYIISDSITDWKDSDNVVSLNGAENSRYMQKNGDKFKIRNSGAIQHREELRLINGIDSMSEEEWISLKSRLYYGNGNVANLSLMDSKFLAYILNLDESKAESLIKIREEDIDKFIKLIFQSDVYNDKIMGFHMSRQLLIEVVVSIEGAVTKVNTLIDFRPTTDERLYTTVSYRAL